VCLSFYDVAIDQRIFVFALGVLANCNTADLQKLLLRLGEEGITRG
jgi:hypothetical protein